MKRIIIAVILAFTVGGRELSAQNAMQTLANSMAPGSWAELTGAANINYGSAGASEEPGLMVDSAGGNRTPYAHTGTWDPNTLTLSFIGSDHGEWQCINSVYSAASHSWSRGPDTELTGTGTVNHQPNNSACLHEFDHQAVDPATGTQYWTAAHQGQIWKLPPSSSTWERIPDWTTTLGNPAIAYGLAFWSGSMTGTSTGALFAYNCGAFWSGTPPPSPATGMDGQVVIYSPGSNTWISDGIDIAGFGYQGGYTYQCMADYSPVHNVGIFGGGGALGTHIWRLNSDRTVTALTDAPYNLGPQYGNVANDPVSGNFVMLASRQMYELDPRESGTWTTLDASHNPPAGTNNFIGWPNTDHLDNMYSVPISSYGVIAYVGCGSNSCAMWLYKHSATSAATDGPGGGTHSGGLLFLTILLTVLLPHLLTRTNQLASQENRLPVSRLVIRKRARDR